jgi:hypothetical protein
MFNILKNLFKKPEEQPKLKEYKLQFTRMETYEVEIVAYDEEEAYDIATSKRGEYLERKTISGHTIFDQDYIKENGQWQMV